MSKIEIAQENLIEYVRDMMSTFKLTPKKISDAKYHHTTKYADAPSVCEHGILTLIDLNKRGIRNDSIEFIRKMDDIDSHINGAAGVSFAVVGLNDLARDEIEYNPFEPSKVDFVVSSDIKARRATKHYGNEFICDSSVTLDKIKAVDIRIMDLLDNAENIGIKLPGFSLVETYNSIIEMSQILSSNPELPLREMSKYGDFAIDVSKAGNSPKIKLLKK